jgi:hypothetical protein
VALRRSSFESLLMALRPFPESEALVLAKQAKSFKTHLERFYPVLNTSEVWLAHCHAVDGVVNALEAEHALRDSERPGRTK